MGARRVLSGRAGIAAAGCVALLALAGCGAEDFPNEPRPAAPIELSALVTNATVEVGPDGIGAGTVNVTVTNQTDEATGLAFEGPTDAETQSVPAGGIVTAKLSLEEGDYEVATTGEDSEATAANLAVGAERPSSQNDLLLP